MPSQIINYADFTGGLSKKNPTIINDNQFEELTNYSVNSDGRVQTRKGVARHSVVYEDIITLNTAEATTDWSVSGEATNLTLDITNEIRGSGALNFDLNAYSTGTSNLTLAAGSTIDITNYKGFITVWVKFPTGYDTDLASIRLRLGSDSSNYYEWTLTNPTANEDTYIKLDFTDATSTGTPVDASIDFFELNFTTNAGYSGYTDFVVDEIKLYGSLSTQSIPSIYGVRNHITDEDILICNNGTDTFLYNEDASFWEQIDTGLTQFESDGVTHTRWDFISYDQIIYMVNGVDQYRYWNGKVMTTTAAQQGRYFGATTDNRFILTGDDSAPGSTLYSDRNPADLATYANSYGMGKEADGKINMYASLGAANVYGKTDKLYSLDFSSTIPTVTRLDLDDGGFSHRASQGVGNGLLYLNKAGVDQMAQKTGAVGAQALEGTNISSDIKSIFTSINEDTRNLNCSHYIKELTNYYFTYSSTGDDKPDKTIVYSSLVGKSWAEHTLPAIFDYTRHIDSNNVVRHLASSANSGIIWSIEDGYTDDGAEIEYKLKTKRLDFGDVATRKDYDAVDIIGLKNKSSDIDVNVIVDGDTVMSRTITDTQITSDTPVSTLSTTPLSTVAIAGGGSESTEIKLYPYRARLYLSGTIGSNIQIELTSSGQVTQNTLDQIMVGYDNEAYDVIESKLILS